MVKIFDSRFSIYTYVIDVASVGLILFNDFQITCIRHKNDHTMRFPPLYYLRWNIYFATVKNLKQFTISTFFFPFLFHLLLIFLRIHITLFLLYSRVLYLFHWNALWCLYQCGNTYNYCTYIFEVISPAKSERNLYFNLLFRVIYSAWKYFRLKCFSQTALWL